jgi:hypothetical protein
VPGEDRSGPTGKLGECRPKRPRVAVCDTFVEGHAGFCGTARSFDREIHPVAVDPFGPCPECVGVPAERSCCGEQIVSVVVVDTLNGVVAPSVTH